ncbi:hypothetical protein CF319_g2278 [Tilletia indica]|uniref:Uncharacterized protein n=1 Tax=Tilletia indica TaxID=43049 RepID=A0A177TUZ8_9BASI|nr:hypothetical protein CF319_g2278 [Tilletia indica]KAE8259931.1 hypothetical protein A4X13_0g665 [Tilletia indica]
MPLCTVLLLSLDGGHAGIGAALNGLRNAKVEILTAAHVHRPIIRSSTLDTAYINDTEWHLLLVARQVDSKRLLDIVSAGNGQLVKSSYAVTVGIPSKVYNRYESHSEELSKRPAPALSSSIDRLPASLRAGEDGKPRDSQNLEVSDDLQRFAEDLEKSQDFRQRPVVMLNLLQFRKGKHESYKQYGKGFVTIGARHGGDAKLVGLVVAPPADFASDSRGDRARPAQDWWNEAAYAFYPSIRHFVDMAADSEYQDINQKFRLPALRDTTIICTTELDWRHPVTSSSHRAKM